VSPSSRRSAASKFIAALEEEGWYLKRVRGSHRVLRHPNIPDAIPVPVHGSREIKRGTIASIL
jgi:predicted RNA binding protein YcfA (HicA-like mRNA interferase family)